MTNAARKPKTRVLANLAKAKRAQKVLGAKAEIEAIERALDFVIEESANNRLALKSNQRFIKSGGEIKDVFGKLDR
jgi:hypothetical protein